MKGNTLKIIAVGRLKQKWWSEAASHYLALVRHWRALEYVEVRDGPAGLDVGGRMAREGAGILRHVSAADFPMALWEKGSPITSVDFAAMLQELDRADRRNPVFIIGGPYGLPDSVLDVCARKLSLSAMTWTHEMARVLLLEQLYRAGCILRGIPYHHR